MTGLLRSPSVANCCLSRSYNVRVKNALYDSRLFLLDVYDSSTKDLLREKSFKHPIFGQVPLSQWFPFVGLHEKRHLKQLKKTIEMDY